MIKTRIHAEAECGRVASEGISSSLNPCSPPEELLSCGGAYLSNTYTTLRPAKHEFLFLPKKHKSILVIKNFEPEPLQSLSAPKAELNETPPEAQIFEENNNEIEPLVLYSLKKHHVER